MATAKKRGDSCRIVPSVDYGDYGKQLCNRMTWTPQQGMTSRQIEKDLDRQAVLFALRTKK